MRLTKKQHQIMDIVIDGNLNEEGKWDSWRDLDQIMELLPYDCTKESLHCSLRFLRKKGLIKKGDKVLRDSRWRTPVIPTREAVVMFRGSADGKYTIEDDVVTLTWD